MDAAERIQEHDAGARIGQQKQGRLIEKCHKQGRTEHQNPAHDGAECYVGPEDGVDVLIRSVDFPDEC